MDARLAQQDLRYLLPLNRTHAQEEAEALRLAAVRARDEATACFVRGIVSGVWNGIKALLAMPRRIAVFDELSALTDRELADIGLTRADIRRVFDTGFVARAEPVYHEMPAPAAAQVPANSNDRLAAAA